MSETDEGGGTAIAMLQRRMRDLSSEVRRLQDSIAALEDARENDLAVQKRLRRLIQDGHQRERHLRRRLDDLTAAGADGAAPPRVGAVTGENGPGHGAAGVDPGLVLRAMAAPEPPDYWAPPEAVLEPLAVHPGWAAYEDADEEGVVLGFSLLGLDDDGRRRVLDLVLAQQAAGEPLRPVFITDNDDFAALREAHFVFEYLPPWPGPDIVPDRAAWDDYLVERLVTIRRKWGIRRYLTFAAGADRDASCEIDDAMAVARVEAEAAAAARAMEDIEGTVGADAADDTQADDAQVDAGGEEPAPGGDDASPERG